MKNTYLTLILFIGLSSITGLSSCRMSCVHGSGNKTTETRKVSGFTKIKVEGGYVVNLKQDSSGTMTINADDNLMQYIRSNTDGDVLHISSKKNFCTSGPVTITIGINKLDELKGSGAVEFVSDGKINTKDLNIDLTGASRITLDLNAANVITTGSGSTEINLKGQASSHKVNLTGSGKLSALDFVVGDYNIETTGASDCQINVLNNLIVKSTGASDVKYRGNPANIKNDKTGASSITKVD